MRLDINDFLVTSVLSALRVILPDKTYEKVNQDYIEMLLKCNIELSRLTNQKSDKIDAMLTSDQLTKLT